MINKHEHNPSLEIINTGPNNTFTVFYFNKYPLYDMKKQIIGEMFMGSHFPGVPGMSQFGLIIQCALSSRPEGLGFTRNG